MWDLSSQTRDWTHIPSVGRQILNHGTTREVPAMYFKHLPACLIVTFTGHHLSEALWTSPTTVTPLFFSSLYPYLICSTYHSALQLLALLYISITKSNSFQISLLVDRNNRFLCLNLVFCNFVKLLSVLLAFLCELFKIFYVQSYVICEEAVLLHLKLRCLLFLFLV